MSNTLNNEVELKELLVEALTQIKALNIRLDNMHVTSEPTESDNIAWESMFEHMIYTAGKYNIMPNAFVDLYEGITSNDKGMFITPKAYGMLRAKVRRTSPIPNKDIKQGEMLTVPGNDCVYVIRYDVNQSTRPAIKTVTHAVIITADRRGMGRVAFVDDHTEIVMKAYKHF